MIAGAAPDVVALQEVVSRTASEYRAQLAIAGFGDSVDSFSLAPDPMVLVGARRYGLVVISRWPVEPIVGVPVRMPWPERLL